MKKPTSYAINPEVRDHLNELAEAHNISASNLLERLIESHYKRWEVPGMSKQPKPFTRT